MRVEKEWIHNFVLISTVHGSDIYKFMSLKTEPNAQPGQSKPDTELVASI